MDETVQEILFNFSAELEKFRNKEPHSKILQYFMSKNVSNPGFMKSYTNSTVIASTSSNKANGYGIVQYPNKTIYVGQLIDGKKHGFGVRSYLGNGLAYVGEYDNDIKSGKGKLYDFQTNKYIFDGEWANDHRNGYGELDKEDVKYKGNYVDDKMEGKGLLTWSNGNAYEGDFKNDLRHGRGIMKFYNGDRYEGDFENGLMHGDGVYVWKNGERYIGEFKEGMMCGQGKVDYGFNVIAQGVFEGDSTRTVDYALSGEFGKYQQSS